MICKQCGKEYDIIEARRKYGDATFIHFYCSPQCYTKTIMEKKDEKKDKRLDVLVLVQEYGSKMIDVASARCISDRELIKKHLKKANEILQQIAKAVSEL